MNKLMSQLQKARNSKWHLWWLNFGLWRMVPFNAPHRLKITSITEDSITIRAENVRVNQNHIRGIHACLLATLCEYASGLSLLSRLNPKEYRIILKSLQMTYHYQAKTAVNVTFTLTQEWLESEILAPLGQHGKLFKEIPVEAYDLAGNHICTGLVNWQIKLWKDVKTTPT
jgi:acyl-coenzyme A thioesterase PaaI-like protein